MAGKSIIILPNSLSVGSECRMSLGFNLPLFIFLLLLLLNDAEEFSAFSLCLLGHHDFLLDELLATCLIKLYGLLSRQLSLLFLFSASFTLSILECSLGTQCVNLTLTIGSSFLQLTKALDFKLFLSLDASLLGSLSFFLGDTIGVVPDNLKVLFSLLSLLYLLSILSNVVCDLDFSLHLFVTSFFGFGYLHIFFFLLLHDSKHLLLLALERFSLLLSLDLAFLNLLDDNGCTTTLSLNPKPLTLILGLEGLQSFNLHHEV